MLTNLASSQAQGHLSEEEEGSAALQPQLTGQGWTLSGQCPAKDVRPWGVWEGAWGPCPFLSLPLLSAGPEASSSRAMRLCPEARETLPAALVDYLRYLIWGLEANTNSHVTLSK